MQIDRKYRRILSALDENCRETDTQIARTVGLSRDVVRYRIKQLEKENIIRGYMTIINTMKLGYDWYRIFFKFGPSSKQQRTEAIATIRKHASWSTDVEGAWDLNTGIFAKNPYHLRDIITAVLDEHSCIQEHEVSAVTRMWHYPRKFLKEQTDNATTRVMGYDPSEEYEEKELDEKDMQILRELQEDARIHTVELAERIGMSESTVRYRIKKLEEDGIILGYRPFLDVEKLGYQYFKVHLQLHRQSTDSREHILHELHRHPNTLHTTELVNGADIETEFIVKNLQELYKHLHALRDEHEEITRYDVLQYTHEYDFSYLPKT